MPQPQPIQAPSRRPPPVLPPSRRPPPVLPPKRRGDEDDDKDYVPPKPQDTPLQ